MPIQAKNSEVSARSIKVVEGKETHGDIRMKLMMSGDKMNLLEIKYAPGAGAPLHIHQHETVCYVVEGKVRITVGDEVFELGAGDSCIHPAGIPHGIEGVEQATVLEIKSPAQAIDQFLGTTS